ncbi:MAG: hypothetical protein J0L52_03890 [Caulobacterales bacterium]|nr:hypothetical protein [Caulobacterales bacterium]
MTIAKHTRLRLAAVGLAGSLGLSGCASYDPYLMQDALMVAEFAVWVAAEDARRDAYRAERDYYRRRGHHPRAHHGPKAYKPTLKGLSAPAA